MPVVVQETPKYRQCGPKVLKKIKGVSQTMYKNAPRQRRNVTKLKLEALCKFRLQPRHWPFSRNGTNVVPFSEVKLKDLLVRGKNFLH